MHRLCGLVKPVEVGHASQVHLPGGNHIHTIIELSETEVPATDTRLFVEYGCQSTDRTKSSTLQPLLSTRK